MAPARGKYTFNYTASESSDNPAAGKPTIEMEKVHWLEIPDQEKQAIFYDNITKLVGVED
jgi:predicted TIM-barrel fold metal-dependent hydrolase